MPPTEVTPTDQILVAATPRPPLRLWPGIALIAVMGAVKIGAAVAGPEGVSISFKGSLACSLAIVVWWLFFSRAPWVERVGALVMMAVALVATKSVAHPSIAGGAMGFLVYVLAVPTMAFALAAAAVATQRASMATRRVAIAAAILTGGGMFAAVRTSGLSMTTGSDLHWRWTPTPEERLLAQGGDKPKQASSSRPAPLQREEASAPKFGPQWPGFRGPNRDGVLRGVRIETEWTAAAPTEVWRKPIGPGWSSFAVDGERFYTQEQRGEEELVSCYHLGTGELVWTHADAARFYESNAGPGPRGTPTLHNGRVYALGATGLLNALDSRTGAKLWGRDAATEVKRKIPAWGFAGSPLIVGELVVIALSGKLAAFDLTTGNPVWIAEKPGYGYASPHLATLGGVPQILLLNGTGAVGVAPTDGAVLWQHEWKSDGIVQPAVLADGDVLIGSGSGIGSKVGVQRVAVTRSADRWATEEKWTSNRMKPYFNDFVVQGGHAYGFDGSGLACIELTGGDRKWKGGRYGQGQVLLIADQDVMLVVAEQGDLALVRAAPDEFKELARIPALKGKTWNHPVLAGDILLLRNDQEMVALRLKLRS